MLCPYISASRLSTYLQCPHQYYSLYELSAVKESASLSIGTIVHFILENYHAAGFTVDNLTEPETLTTILSLPYAPHLPLTSMDFRAIVDLLLGVKQLEVANRDKGYETVARELEVTPEQTQDWFGVPIKGIIDRVDRKDNHILIIDYKTGYYMENNVDDNLQLGIYDLFASKLYPDCSVTCEIWNVRHGTRVTANPKTDKDREYLLSYLGYMRQVILADETHEPKVNSFCSTCAVNQCKAAQIDGIGTSDNVPFEILLKHGYYDAALQEYNRIQSLSKLLEKQLESYQQSLRPLLDEKKVIEGEKYTGLLMDNKRRSIDYRIAKYLVPEEVLDEIAYIKISDVDKLPDNVKEVLNTCVEDRIVGSRLWVKTKNR